MGTVSLLFHKVRNLRYLLSKIFHIELCIIFFAFVFSNFVEALTMYSSEKNIVPPEVEEAKLKIENNRCGTVEASTPEMVLRCNDWKNIIKNHKPKSFWRHFFGNIFFIGTKFLKSISLQTQIKLALSFILFYLIRRLFP